MSSKQSMIEATTQAATEAAKKAIMALKETETTLKMQEQSKNTKSE